MNNTITHSTINDTVRIHTSVSPSGIIHHHTIPLELTLAELINDTVAVEQYEAEQQFLNSVMEDFSPIDTQTGVV